jgi:hypothetical protein
LPTVTRSAICGKVRRMGLARRAPASGRRHIAEIPADGQGEQAARNRRGRTLAEQREADRLAKQRRRRAAGIMPRGSEPSLRPAAVVSVAPPSLCVPFIETSRDHCRWICSEAGEPVTVCGHQAVSGGSWCTHHRGVVFPSRREASGPFIVLGKRKQHASRSLRFEGHA